MVFAYTLGKFIHIILNTIISNFNCFRELKKRNWETTGVSIFNIGKNFVTYAVLKSERDERGWRGEIHNLIKGQKLNNVIRQNF